MSNYSRYSHHARRAMTHAGLLVKRFRHPRVDTGHLLVGVLLSKGSIGYNVLRALDLDTAQAVDALKELTLPNDEAPDAPQNDAALDIALDLAADESVWLGHHYIGTEHLLLGITRTNLGNASDLLRQLSVQPDQLRRRVRAALSEGLQEDHLQLVRRGARLSELSRRVINAAEQMAVALDHETVGLGHLLLVLRRERRATTAELLQKYGFDTTRANEIIEGQATQATVRVEAVLLAAGEYAQQIGTHYTGTEHLLLAFCMNPDGKALLHTCGVDSQALSTHLAEKTSR